MRKNKAMGCGERGGCRREYRRVWVWGADKKILNQVDR